MAMPLHAQCGPLLPIGFGQEAAQARHWCRPGTSIASPLRRTMLELERCVFLSVLARCADPVLPQHPGCTVAAFPEQELDEIANLGKLVRRQLAHQLLQRRRFRTHSMSPGPRLPIGSQSLVDYRYCCSYHDTTWAWLSQGNDASLMAHTPERLIPEP